MSLLQLASESQFLKTRI